MSKVFNSNKIAAANRRGAMEADTISKTRAILKSHKSRVNFLIMGV